MSAAGNGGRCSGILGKPGSVPRKAIANDDVGDGLTLDLTISGDHQGQFTYHNDTYAEAWVIRGTYDNARIVSRHQR